MTRPSLIAVTIILLAVTAAAGDSTRVIASVAGEKGGGGATVLFTRINGWTLGFTANTLDQTRWYYVTGGLTRRLSRRVIVDLQADVGSQSGARRDFDYTIFRAAVVHELVEQSLWGELETRYIDVGDQRGNLLKGGLTVAVGQATRFNVAAYQSTSGNLDSRFFTARVDRSLGSYSLLAGAAAGRGGAAILDRPGSPGRQTDVRQAFAGIEFPAAAGRLQVVLDLIDTEGSERLRGVVTWRSTP